MHHADGSLVLSGSRRRKTGRARRLRLAVGLYLLALGSAARAQPAPAADPCLADARCVQLSESARSLSRDGQLEAALTLYQAAYAQHAVPWLLVNIGRLQQKLYHLPEAIKTYHQFLERSDASEDPELRKKVEEYLQQAETDPKAALPPVTVPTDECAADLNCAELIDTARTLSKAGQLEAALKLYAVAYQGHPVPWLLVNIGRIQQKLGQLSEAITSYRQYLKSADAKADPDRASKAQEYLQQAEADYEPPPAPLVPPPPPPLPPPPLPGDGPGEGYGGASRQKQRGLVVELGLGSRRPAVQVDATTAQQASSFGGSLALGYKYGRLLVRLGFELDSFSTTTSFISPVGSSQISTTTTSYLVKPGVQLALLRVAADRLELLAAGELGLGQASTNRVQDPPLVDPLSTPSRSVNFHLNYQLGPGLRVFVLPRLAVTLLSGLAADHFFAAQDNPAGVRQDQLNNLSLFGHLSLMGVF